LYIGKSSEYIKCCYGFKTTCDVGLSIFHTETKIKTKFIDLENFLVDCVYVAYS